MRAFQDEPGLRFRDLAFNPRDREALDNDSHRVGRIRIGVLGSQGLGSGWSAMLLDDLAITP